MLSSYPLVSYWSRTIVVCWNGKMDQYIFSRMSSFTKKRQSLWLIYKQYQPKQGVGVSTARVCQPLNSRRGRRTPSCGEVDVTTGYWPIYAHSISRFQFWYLAIWGISEHKHDLADQGAMCHLATGGVFPSQSTDILIPESKTQHPCIS